LDPQVTEAILVVLGDAADRAGRGPAYFACDLPDCDCHAKPKRCDCSRESHVCKNLSLSAVQTWQGCERLPVEIAERLVSRAASGTDEQSGIIDNVEFADLFSLIRRSQPPLVQARDMDVRVVIGDPVKTAIKKIWKKTRISKTNQAIVEAELRRAFDRHKSSHYEITPTRELVELDQKLEALIEGYAEFVRVERARKSHRGV
jgi:hypothetical protein